MSALFRRALGAAAVLLGAAGCTGSHGTTVTATAPPTTPGSAATSAFPSSQPLPSGSAGPKLPVRLPTVSSVDNQDATAVAEAVIEIQWTMDTAADTSQYQAELRSAPFLAAGYLASLKSDPPVAAPGEQWNDWTRHRAYTTVSAAYQPGDQPPDTAGLAVRRFRITVTPHSRDGSPVGGGYAETVFVSMIRTGAVRPWRVDALSVSS